MRLFILAMSFLVAGLAGASAINGVAKRKSPELPISMGSKNGLVLESQTQFILKRKVIKEGGVLPNSFSESSMDLAKTAFINEPTAYKAVGFLALGLESKRQIKTTRTLMKNVIELNKRDRVANMWFVNNYGQQGDLKSVLHYYDIILRTSKNSASLLMPLLAKALEHQQAIDPLKDMLANQPPWASDFWHSLARNPNSLENASILSMQLRNAGIANPANNNATIIKNLVVNGQLKEANNFFKALSKESSSKSMALLQNEDFSKVSMFAPFDWELFSTGEYGAVIDQNTGTMLVSAVANTEGLVARQLFAMGGGRYALTVKHGDWPNRSQPTAKVTIRCAEKNARDGFVLEKTLGTQNLHQNFIIDSGSCMFFWLEFSVLNDGQGQGIDLPVNTVAISRKNE